MNNTQATDDGGDDDDSEQNRNKTQVSVTIDAEIKDWVDRQHINLSSLSNSLLHKEMEEREEEIDEMIDNLPEGVDVDSIEIIEDSQSEDDIMKYVDEVAKYLYGEVDTLEELEDSQNEGDAL